ncbi:MAG: anti-sigma factor [Gammaproteobacteria bacterium]|jgi:anti-sigma factor (TIGR02949 family)|nr:anti-sigma factor [Gammaproteobacteria bacterium]
MKHDIGCLQAIEAFYAYLDGELDNPESIEEFEHHLGHCRSCFSRIDMEKALNKRLRETAQKESPDDLRDRVSKLLAKF